MVAKPRNRAELDRVGLLVDRHPEEKRLGIDRELGGGRVEVGADEKHARLARLGAERDDVLAEDPLGRVTHDGTGLRSGRRAERLAGDRPERPRQVELAGEPLLHRHDERRQLGDVRRDPLLAPDDLDLRHGEAGSSVVYASALSRASSHVARTAASSRCDSPSPAIRLPSRKAMLQSTSPGLDPSDIGRLLLR